MLKTDHLLYNEQLNKSHHHIQYVQTKNTGVLEVPLRESAYGEDWFIMSLNCKNTVIHHQAVSVIVPIHSEEETSTIS